MKKPISGSAAAHDETKTAGTHAFNKQRYGDLIRGRRGALGMTQAQLARILGVQKAYVTHWEAGRARPDLNLIPALCRALEISVAAFFRVPESADSLSPGERRHIEAYRGVSARDRLILDAVLTKMEEIAAAELWERCRSGFHIIYRNDQRAAAGSGISLDADASGEPVFIRSTPLSDRADEIVTVSGASMEPDFRSGQDVYVEHTPELDIGEIGLFVVNGDGFIKQYMGDYLHSLNPEYGDIRLDESDDARIAGRVLGVVDAGDYPTREEQSVLQELLRETQ